MKYRLNYTALLLGTCLLAPLNSQAGEASVAIAEATEALERASALGFEWRDSRKLLKKAVAASHAGDSDKAVELANKARQQGIIAVAQAREQAGITGPYQR